MDKRLLFRLLFVPLIVYMLCSIGLHIEVALIFGVIYLAFILLRGKLWRGVDKAIEKHLPFTRRWPDNAQKALLVAMFIVALVILKQSVYFALGLAGIDLQEAIMSAAAG